MIRRITALAVAAVALGWTSSAPAQIVTGLTSTGSLVTFNSNAPAVTINTTPVITGLTAGDVLAGIDYRPADGSLIGLGYNSSTGTARVYTLNTVTGVATSINSNTITLGIGIPRVTADFNPTANAIRVVTGLTAGNNLRITAAGAGTQAADTDLNPGTTTTRATAYSRNVPGGGTSGATTLYEINGTGLVTQGSVDFVTGNGTSPNSGTLFTVAPLSGALTTPASVVGFDIYSSSGADAGSAFLSTAGSFYTLNLGTGVTTLVGNYTGVSLVDIAVVPVPEPGSMALMGVAGLGLGRMVWKRRKAVV